MEKEKILKVCRNVAPKWIVSYYPIFPICAATVLDKGIAMQAEARKMVKKTAIEDEHFFTEELFRMSKNRERWAKSDNKSQ